MKIVNLAEVPVYPNPHHVDARKVYDSKDAVAIVITLKPGEALKRHITPVDVFFYVLEGTGVVEIGDEGARVDRDHLVKSPAGVPHRWSNDADQDFRVLVVKVPRPTGATKLL